MVNTPTPPPPTPPAQGQPTDNYALEVTVYSDRQPADTARCEMCGAHLGFISGDAEVLTTHVTYYAVHLAGDAYDTAFCEDCYGWLADAAPVITAATAQGDPS